MHKMIEEMTHFSPLASWLSYERGQPALFAEREEKPECHCLTIVLLEKLSQMLISLLNDLPVYAVIA